MKGDTVRDKALMKWAAAHDIYLGKSPKRFLRELIEIGILPARICINWATWAFPSVVIRCLKIYKQKATWPRCHIVKFTRPLILADKKKRIEREIRSQKK